MYHMLLIIHGEKFPTFRGLLCNRKSFWQIFAHEDYEARKSW